VIERDHWAEAPATWVGAVCDRGIRHVRNEDAMAIAADPAPGSFAALVVCDGVSSAPDSDVASLAAARAAREVLCEARRLEPDDPVAFWSERLQVAGAAADRAAAAAMKTGEGGTRPTNPPSCTFVTGIVDGPTVVTGCVGDSRAYWIPDTGTAVQLTRDDSWAAEQMAHGVPRATAEAGPHAHAITRWLGADSPDNDPTVTSFTATEPGWLLVCSDGLWNYCSEAEPLAALVHGALATEGPSLVAVAEELVAWANQQGGMDNITVALARVAPGPSEGAPPSDG
jgi:serine/threonine protein phosphatase PrpC